jgi:hypothetical protein
MSTPWDVILDEFRALGGKADNIALREGALGRGIFPVDRTKPVLLHVPGNLLIPVSDVELVNDRLRIKDSAEIGAPERAFFENYQDTLSWGGGGREDAIAFVEALDRLPAQVRTALSTQFGLKAMIEGGSGRALQWFLGSRMITRGTNDYLMPMMELVNHTPSSARHYDIGVGISVEGTFSDEVLALYNVVDSWGIFRAFGFASPEEMAFSLPMGDKIRHGLVIENNINFDTKRGSFQIPDFRLDGDVLVLSCMMIGNAKFPRLSRGIFNAVMKEIGRPNSDEVFDGVLHYNRAKFHSLLSLLEPHEGGLIPTLRKAVRHQLEAMSQCVGTREL